MKNSAVVVYVIRICGVVMSIHRVGDRMRFVRRRTYTHTPPDQRPVIDQLRG